MQSPSNTKNPCPFVSNSYFKDSFKGCSTNMIVKQNSTHVSSRQNMMKQKPEICVLPNSAARFIAA